MEGRVKREAGAVERDVEHTGPTLLPALGTLPGHLFWRAQARVTAALATALPPGVDIHAYAVLLALADGAARSQQELADTISVSRTTMARVARDLAEQGLVDRARNPADRRSYALTLTDDGAAAARSWRRYADDLESAITAGFSDDERADLTRLLLRLVESDLAHDVPDELRTSTGFLLTRAHAIKHREFSSGLASLGIEPRDYGSLRALQELGAVPQAELARSMGVSGATVVEIVDVLEAQGLVERRRAPGDRRTQLLHLPPATGPLLERADELALQVSRVTLGLLTSEERERLMLLLRRFITAPGPASGPATAGPR